MGLLLFTIAFLYLIAKLGCQDNKRFRNGGT